MLIIKVRKGNIEQALKQMRRKFVKTQTMKNLRTQRYYKKPSEERREEIQKARTASGDLKEFSGTDAGTILDYYMTNHPDVMNDVIDVSDLDAEWQIENLKDEMATVKADQEDMVLKAQLAHEIIKEYKNTFEDFRKFRVLLGSIELVNPFDESDVLIASLGDIPLSLPYFQDWLVSETLKNNSKRMPLTSFLNKLVSKAVSSALNDDSMFGGMLKQKVRIGKTEVKCNNQYQEKIDDLTFLMLQTNKNLKDNFATYLKVKFGFDGLMDQWSEMSDGEKQKVQDAIGIEPRTSYAFINGLTSPVLEPAALGEDPLRDGATDREMDYLLFFQNRTAPIGTYKGEIVTVNNGRYGPYLKYNNTFYSIPKDESPLTIGINRAVDILSKPKKSSNRSIKPLKELGKHPKDNENIALFKGRYGLYIKYKGINFSLPKSSDPEKIKMEDIIEIIKKKQKR